MPTRSDNARSHRTVLIIGATAFACFSVVSALLRWCGPPDVRKELMESGFLFPFALLYSASILFLIIGFVMRGRRAHRGPS
jgi:hypothetical protein